MPVRRPAATAHGRRIVIIGAGIAGMVLAWELRKAGYAPLILEARTAPAAATGRCVAATKSARPRACSASPGIAAPHMYFNPGPARLPYHHQGILSYCRELDVPLEVMCNDNRGALLQTMRHSTASRSATGRWSTISAATWPNWPPRRSTVTRSPQAVTTEDKERIRALLRSFGALDKDMAYRGSGRAGYSEPPGGGTQEGTLQPAARSARPSSMPDFWRFQTNFGESWDQAATMMQPVGGMGRIGQAFGRATATARSPMAPRCARCVAVGNGARIDLAGREDRRERAIEAPLVVVTIPLPVLRTIPADFPAGDPRGHRVGGLRARGQDRLPGRTPVLGTG